MVHENKKSESIKKANLQILSQKDLFQVFFEQEFPQEEKEKINKMNTDEPFNNEFKPKNMKIESAFDIIFDPNYKE